ncbi:fas-binding factor 1 isoform X2 [Petaurus breviceps papuanus]|uniref:fas-binding factor 1 isoform X2 n=1 Tax=Petaurus breviceps papuanus TaxID=3040969 RepID=UPI0036DCDB20
MLSLDANGAVMSSMWVVPPAGKIATLLHLMPFLSVHATKPPKKRSTQEATDISSKEEYDLWYQTSSLHATKMKKGLKSSIDDVLGDLLDDDTMPAEKPLQSAANTRDNLGSSRGFSLRAKKKSILEDDFFSTMAAQAGADAEFSDISDADPQALIRSMKDMDDMDADLLGLMKSNLTSNKTAAKGSGKEEIPGDRPTGKVVANERGENVSTKKPVPSTGSIGRPYKKFSFDDLEDPMAGLLSDEEEGTDKKLPMKEGKAVPEKSPTIVKNQGTSLSSTPGDTSIQKKEEVKFDDGDDLMATLGFGDSPKAERKQEKGVQDGPRPARTKLDELLGRGTASKLLERPSTGKLQEFRLDKKYQKQPDKEDPWGDDDFAFGAYQPTVASSSESRQSRRQSVRFSAESLTNPKGEQCSKQSTPATASPARTGKGGADWLGLKDEDFDLLPLSPTKESVKAGLARATPSEPSPVARHSTSSSLPGSGMKPPADTTAIPHKPSLSPKQGTSEEKQEEDWLSHALSQKKSQNLTKEEQPGTSKGLSPTETSALPFVSQHAASTQGPEQTATRRSPGTAPAFPRASGVPPTDAHPKTLATLVPPAAEPKRDALLGEVLSTDLTACFQRSQELTGTSMPVQGLLPESLALSLLPGGEYQKRILAAQAQLQGGTAELQEELLKSQARQTELETQVRKLELERTQQHILLESLQQQHQADLELIESAHRSRIKVLETSYQQREERLQRENEELTIQYLSHCQEAEKARADLLAQHQRRLAAAEQEKDQEIERLQNLQRASILEIQKDHEEQLQRLKRMKDREIDAVTSATSHTRSLNGVIEQMEKFSCSLNELSSRVEATHLTNSQEIEIGARQRDKQLQALQERLTLQQRDMEDERNRLHEIIGKMEARLNEQSRLLEQERWRVSAEQSKAESTQRSLEEQRRVMSQQLSMEREELERAKNALLEEQKSIMHKCAEEGRRLAAEWADFYAQQKLSKERAEREAERVLQVDSQREGTIVSLAKEQAELKIRASELRLQEEQLAGEWEILERERQELRLEKEKVNSAALRIKLQTEEVESMSKVASQKYEEGERALREAHRLQSEHQARLQLMQQQQEQLRQQEQQLHQENLNLAQQRRQLDHLRLDLPSPIMGLSPAIQVLESKSLNAISSPAIPIPGCSQPSAGLGPSHLHAKLVLLKHMAEKDWDFLEDEKFFLETLKKTSYSMTPYTA